jgi:hypothetical protein
MVDADADTDADAAFLYMEVFGVNGAGCEFQGLYGRHLHWRLCGWALLNLVITELPAAK